MKSRGTTLTRLIILWLLAPHLLLSFDPSTKIEPSGRHCPVLDHLAGCLALPGAFLLRCVLERDTFHHALAPPILPGNSHPERRQDENCEDEEPPCNCIVAGHHPCACVSCLFALLISCFASREKNLSWFHVWLVGQFPVRSAGES